MPRAQKGFSHGAPLSQCATFKLVEMTKGAPLSTALRNEYRFCTWCMNPEGEFLEGVRAALVDKDRNPKWKYGNFSDIPDALMDRLEEPALDGDLDLTEA